MKTIHQIYHDGETAEMAVRRLENAGVDSGEITVLRGRTNMAERSAIVGSLLGIAIGAAAAFGIPAVYALPPEGSGIVFLPLACGVLGMLSGAMIGALSDENTPARPHRYEAALRRGGAIVIARVGDNKAQLVRSVLTA